MAEISVHESMRLCTHCGAEKPATADNFYRSKRGLHGLGSICKPCRSAVRKSAAWASERQAALRDKAAAWRAKNRDKARAAGRAAYHANRERNSAASLAYYYANKDKVRAYGKRKYDTRPDHRVRVCMSAAIRKAIRDKKSGRSWETLVGYRIEDLMRHLERQFSRGMTWGNHGPVWHIDHILPASSFRATDPSSEAFRACWALTNLQPLWALANISKGARRDRLL